MPPSLSKPPRERELLLAQQPRECLCVGPGEHVCPAQPGCCSPCGDALSPRQVFSQSGGRIGRWFSKARTGSRLPFSLAHPVPSRRRHLSVNLLSPLPEKASPRRRLHNPGFVRGGFASAFPLGFYLTSSAPGELNWEIQVLGEDRGGDVEPHEPPAPVTCCWGAGGRTGTRGPRRRQPSEVAPCIPAAFLSSAPRVRSRWAPSAGR